LALVGRVDLRPLVRRESAVQRDLPVLERSRTAGGTIQGARLREPETVGDSWPSGMPMTQSPKDRSFLPHGWSTVTPRIVVRGARQLVDFLVGVFNASGEFQEDRPSVVWLDESPIMVSEAGIRAPMPAFLYVYVADTDGTYRRAVDPRVCARAARPSGPGPRPPCR